jgi:peptide/histidine transporter 3/4
VLKQNTGTWKACPFILGKPFHLTYVTNNFILLKMNFYMIWNTGNECCERLAYYGIATNLVTYLTRKLHEGNASAARNVTTWQGTCYLAPLIGAVLADSYWGRYWTIAIFSMIYFIVITNTYSLIQIFLYTHLSNGTLLDISYTISCRAEA